MKILKTAIFLLVAAFLAIPLDASAKSNRQERQLISKGNKQYVARKYVEAASLYEQAIKANPSSTAARFNLGLSQIRQVTNPADTTPKNRNLLDQARKNLADVASQAKEKPGLAAKANYNLGNLEFNVKEYQKAIDFYKQALRIDPSDQNARRNLRIAQKNLQKQNQDKNKDQNKDKDKDKDKDKNQQQQPQQQPQQPKPQPQQPKEEKINSQTAERILQAVDNKESQTRARVNRATKGEKGNGSSVYRKKW